MSSFFLTNRHLVWLGFLLSVVSIGIAAYLYPGGSNDNPESTGYSFTQNYITHLVDYNALNGQPNTARPWGVLGIVLMGMTTGLALVRFAKKINLPHYSMVIQLGGYLLVVTNALVTIPSLHDAMVLIGVVFTLLVFFYVTILIFKTRLTALKMLALTTLLFYYAAVFMFYSRTGLFYMPTMQKMVEILHILFILGMEYFTAKADFSEVR